MSTRLLPFAIVVLLTLSALTIVPLPGASATANRPGGASPPCPTANPFTLNLTWGASSSWVGPAPVNVTINLNVNGSIGTYQYNISIGSVPREFLTGQFNQTNASGLATATRAPYPFNQPGNYTLNATVTYSCGGIYSANEFGTVLPVYGPAGPNPLSATGSQSSPYVSGTATYGATVHGRPVGSTLEWVVNAPGVSDTYPWYANLTVLNITPLGPGQVSGWLYVVYPSGLLYAMTVLPNLTFQPDVVVAVNFTAPTAGSPTQTTMYANVSQVAGAPVVSGASTVWQFPLGLPLGVTVTGNLAGSPITPTFFFNSSSPSSTAVVMRAAYLGTVSGETAVLGTQAFTVDLWNLTGGPIPPALQVVVVNNTLNVSGGVFSFQLMADVGNPGSYLYDLNLNGYNQSSGLVAWVDNTTNWNGSATLISLAEPATNYTVNAQLYEIGVNATLILDAVYNVTVDLPVGPPSCTSGCTSPPPPPVPLSLALSATPSNGTAVLNVSISVTASGGAAPYDLSVCSRGPSATFPIYLACGPATTVTGWNGSAYLLNQAFNASGYYAINATVSDSNGSFAWASTVINVSAPGARPVLQAQASVIAPSGGSGGTYSFLTQVTGGVAPYDIQWTFGDGTSGSAVPGSTITHVYTTAGTFEPTLKVTDAHGTVVTTHVGPFTVVLPPGGGSGARTTGLSGLDTALLAGAVVVVLASLIAIALVTRWAAGRREALNWLHDLEQGRGPGGPTGPK